MKACKKCGGIEFYASKNCKHCSRERVAKWKLENKEKVLESSKRCYLANHNKEIERHAKYRKENSEKLRVASAKYRIENAEIIQEKSVAVSKKYYSNNRDKCIKRSANYRANNPSKARESTAKWRRCNPNSDVEYRANNLHKVRAANAKWSFENKDARRINRQNRRARQFGGVISKDLPVKLFKLQRGKCACCGEQLGSNFHLDHIMPLALGGANKDHNIQLLTATCNMKKGAKHPIIFMQSRGFLL